MQPYCVSHLVKADLDVYIYNATLWLTSNGQESKNESTNSLVKVFFLFKDGADGMLFTLKASSITAHFVWKS